MVRGRCIAVTAVAPMNQWAETTRMPRGRGRLRPSLRHIRVYALLSSVFIGLPCPMNSEGIVAIFASSVGSMVRLRLAARDRRAHQRDRRNGRRDDDEHRDHQFMNGG